MVNDYDDANDSNDSNDFNGNDPTDRPFPNSKRQRGKYIFGGLNGIWVVNLVCSGLALNAINVN